MEGHIIYSDKDSPGTNRAAGVYGKDLLHSFRYGRLIHCVEETEDLWSAILDYDPEGEFVTVNIEESLAGNVSVTASDGSEDRLGRYYSNEEVPGMEDTELFERYVKDVLEEEDMGRLRETNVQSFKADMDWTTFYDEDNLDPENNFR